MTEKTEFKWEFKNDRSIAVSHVVPKAVTTTSDAFLIALGLCLTPFIIGFPFLLWVYLRKNSTKLLLVGKCPSCETGLGIRKNIASERCPACKSRLVINGTLVSAH